MSVCVELTDFVYGLLSVNVSVYVCVRRYVAQSFLTQLLNNTLLCTGPLYPSHTLTHTEGTGSLYPLLLRLCLSVCASI